MIRRRRGAGLVPAVVLDADPTWRGPVLDAEPTSGVLQRWLNDPPSADRCGRYRRRIGMGLQSDLFANFLTFSRAGVAWDWNSVGDLGSAPADAIRQGYDVATLAPAGWLLEGTATNQVRNPRAEGAVPGVIGAGGALATNWTASVPTAIGVEILGTGEESGIPYIDYRFFGLASGSAYRIIADSAFVAMVNGETWTSSLYVRLLSGVCPTIHLRVVAPEETGLTFIPTGAPLSGQRYIRTRTLDGTAPGTGRAELRIGVSAGTSYDFALRVGAPQHERNYYASSVIIPPIAAPAVTARGADSLTIGAAAFISLFGNAAQGCVIFDVLPGRAAPAGLDQIIAQIDTGADTDRLVLRNLAGGLAISGDVVAAGSSGGGTASAGSLTVGKVARVGLRWGAGSIAVCKDGGAIQGRATALPGGLANLRLGNRVDGLRPWNSRLRLARGLSYAPADAEFTAACTLGA